MNIDNIIKEALSEDIATGDITTESIVDEDTQAIAEIITKEDGVVSGLDIAEVVFRYLQKDIVFEKKVSDGESIKKGQVIAYIRGKARTILSGERVALNFLQLMSGIATATNRLVLSAGKIKVLDTRKTHPLLRVVEKKAVRDGGGYNHRMGLYDMVLIKENHISIAGSIANAVKKCKKTGKFIVIEIEKPEQIEEAIQAGVDRILLDNMTIEDLKKSIKIINGRTEIEVSGNIDIEKIKRYRDLNIDYISSGAITHSSKFLDMTLLIKKVKK